MATTDLYDLRARLANEEILICFAGPFSHSIIEELGTAVKRYLEAEQVTKTAMMNVFSVFVELTQNLKNYAERKAAGPPGGSQFSSSIVAIGRCGDKYVVSSGNVVLRADIVPVLARLELLAGLDRQALKTLYKEQLRRGGEAGRGAGLGLIDLARSTSEPLQPSLRDIDEQTCFFSLRAVI